MRKILRAAGIGLTAAGVALSAAAGAQAANVALMVNGMGAGNLTDLAMANILGGMFGSYQRQNVPWPQQARLVGGTSGLTLSESINVGANNVDAALQTALKQLKPGEHVTIVGLSAGALVADEELRRLAASAAAPDKSKLDFVVVADSSRINFNKNRYDALLNYTYRPPVNSRYNTKAVTGQYDGYADFPDRPFNLLAVQNAIAGAQIVHIPSMLTKLSTVPASNVTTTVNASGGVTTSYLVPTATLPLVVLNPALKPQEAALRKQIDAAYFRNDPKVIAAATTVAAPVTAPPAATPPAAPVPDVPPADVPISTAPAADVQPGSAARRPSSRSAHSSKVKPAAATRGSSAGR
jgi:hypothetical protein